MSDQVVSVPWSPSLRTLWERMGSTNAIDGLLPAACFIAFNSAFGLGWGIGVAMAVSLGAILFRTVRSEKINPLMWLTLVLVVGPGIAGILANSSDAYLAPPVILGGLFGVVMAVSLIAGRPLIGLMVNGVFPMPDDLREAPSTRRTFTRLTLFWAVVAGGSAVIQLWLLTRLSANVFVAVFHAWNLVSSAIGTGVSFWMLRRLAVRARGDQTLAVA